MKARCTSGGMCFQRGGRAKGWINCALLDVSLQPFWQCQSGQNIHHQLPARASLSTFQKGCISKSWAVCVCLQPAWAGSLLQLLLLLSGGEQGKLQQNRTVLLSAPFWEFRSFLGVSLGPSSTWLTHLVSCWPLLPWLIDNTSMTSYRG